MNDHYDKIIAAAAQISPVLPFHKSATIEKASVYVEEASRQGAHIVVFPECFVPMYPNWSIDFAEPGVWEDHLTEFMLHSVDLDSGDLDLLKQVARSYKTIVVIGINERVKQYDGMLYNSLVFIGQDGEILGVHRKVFPSNREKLFHTRGNGSTLQVYDTPIGRLGGLICYEHLQPLLKYACIAQGEQIHCASWPGWPNFKTGRSNKHVIDIASRAYALEGQCFVIASSLYVPPSEAEKANLGHADWSFFGGSAIIGPSGEYIAGPVYEQETVIYGELDLRLIPKRKASIDVTGRDSAPEVIQLKLNTKNPGFITEE